METDCKKKIPELIVMLTYNDFTVENANKIFEQCKNSKAKLWGLKEKGLPFGQMKELYAYIKECGKTTALEVVAYTEEKCLKGAEMAAECKCDILMGTTFFDSVNDFCKKNGLKYMPFVGRVEGRPSVLYGDIGNMIAEAGQYIQKGVYGFDLLGYRYSGNASAVIERFISQVKSPICLAGGIDSYEKLDEVKGFLPWAFTIGGAFFEKKFGETHLEQIDKVYEYINKSYMNKAVYSNSTKH